MTRDPIPAHVDAAEPVTASKLWRNREYQLLMGGRTMAIIGSSMTGLAMMLVSYDLTQDAAAASVVMAFSLVGNLLVGLPAGALVDRWDRKKTMAIAALLQALVIATVPVAIMLGKLTFAQLCMVAFLAGGLSEFYGPAEQASIKKIVRRDQLGAAMTVNQSRGAIGSIVGPPLSGALYGLGHIFPFLGQVIGEIAAALCALFVRADLRPEREEGEKKRIVAEIRDGLVYVFGNRVLARVAALGCLINFGFNAVMTAIVLNLRAMGTSSGAIGVMEMVVGISTIIGATIVAGILLKKFSVGFLIPVSIIAGTALMIGMGVFPTMVPVTICLGVLMLLLPGVNAGVMGYFTAIVPDSLQGRAGAALGLVSMGLMPLAQICAGVLLEHVGLMVAMMAGIVPCLFAGVWAIFSPILRTIPKTSDFGELAEIGLAG